MIIEIVNGLERTLLTLQAVCISVCMSMLFAILDQTADLLCMMQE